MTFLRKKNIQIDFSVQHLSELRLKSHLLKQTLIGKRCETHRNHLSQILLSANQKNETDFKKLVVSRELFGGAGVLWEIHIENIKNLTINSRIYWLTSQNEN